MNKSIFSKLGFFYFVSILATFTAITSIYVGALDNFSHSLLILFTTLLFLTLTITIAVSFKHGRKEIVKAATAALLTVSFFFHAMGFEDTLNLNMYYFFSGNLINMCIGIIAILLFVGFIYAYISHFKINSSNESDSKGVQANTATLLVIGILSLVQAGLIAYNDIQTGRDMELFLIILYVLFFFISLSVICVETLINEFRTAREMGTLKEFAIKKVGIKAARNASSSRLKGIKAKSRKSKNK